MKPHEIEFCCRSTKRSPKRRYDLLTNASSPKNILPYLLCYQTNRLLWNMRRAKIKWRYLILLCHPDKKIFPRQRANELTQLLQECKQFLSNIRVDIQESLFYIYLFNTLTHPTAKRYK